MVRARFPQPGRLPLVVRATAPNSHIHFLMEEDCDEAELTGAEVTCRALVLHPTKNKVLKGARRWDTEDRRTWESRPWGTSHDRCVPSLERICTQSSSHGGVASRPKATIDWLPHETLSQVNRR